MVGGDDAEKATGPAVRGPLPTKEQNKSSNNKAGKQPTMMYNNVLSGNLSQTSTDDEWNNKKKQQPTDEASICAGSIQHATTKIKQEHASEQDPTSNQYFPLSPSAATARRV